MPEEKDTIISQNPELFSPENKTVEQSIQSPELNQPGENKADQLSDPENLAKSIEGLEPIAHSDEGERLLVVPDQSAIEEVVDHSQPSEEEKKEIINHMITEAPDMSDLGNEMNIINGYSADHTRN